MINLKGLDSNYNLIAILAPINIQWNRKYYEYGTFSIQIPSSSYNSNIEYLYAPSRAEMGKITQVNYTNNGGQKLVQISGVFIEGELNDKLVYPLFLASGNIEDKIINMVNTYKLDIPLLECSASSGLGSNVVFQESNAELGNKCYEVLREQELSYKVTFNFTENKKYFKVYQGLDRTNSQSVNNRITFSTNFKNLENVDYLWDKTNYKNYAVIGGQGEGADRIYEAVDLSNGGYKQFLFIDAKSVEYDTTEMTLLEYKANLQTYGMQKLIEYSIINNIDFDATANSYVYLEDFDLGDKCDIVINELGVIIEARIIEIHEVIKENTQTLNLEFGNQIIKK